MTLDEAIAEVAKNMGLPKCFVNKVYRAYWRSVREHIIALPLKDDLSDKEFSKLQPNVNIPSIGKLYVTLDRYKRVKKVHSIKNEEKQLNLKRNATHKGN